MLWASALALCGAPAAYAQTQAIYGPVSVKLPSSSLFSTSGKFTVPQSVTGPYLLRVQLSAPNSLTSLSFKLNGVQVLGLADFAGGKTVVDRGVTVLASNTSSLQVAGKTGTVITVTVFATPNLPKPVSLTPNPLPLKTGANGTLTASLSPTPAAAGTLSVSSADTSVATVPASVGFASGQASVAIPVTAIGAGSAVVTASANGGSASATVNVTPPPTIASLAPATAAVTPGASTTLTVGISASQTTDTSVSIVTSDPGVASAPAAVTVTAGSASAQFTVGAVAAGTAQITATLNGTSAATSVQVVAPPVVSGETPKDVTLAGGATPEVGAAYSSPGSSIDPASVRLLFDGQDVTSLATVTPIGVLYAVTQPLQDATHTVSLTVADVLGGRTTRTWSFVVDDPAPNFYNETPRDVSLVDRNPTIRVQLSGFGIVASSVGISVDGNDVTVQAEVGIDRIAYTPAGALADGDHTVSVVATDARGVTGAKQWTFTIATPPPPETTDDGDRTPRTFVPEIMVLP